MSAAQVEQLLAIARRSKLPVTDYTAGRTRHVFVTLPTHVSHYVMVGRAVVVSRVAR